jgi:hypothetical protein
MKSMIGTMMVGVCAMVATSLFTGCEEVPFPDDETDGSGGAPAAAENAYVGAEASDPSLGEDSVAMTESKCVKMGCDVVCGSGPSYATWCRCGKAGEKQTFTYIHD